MKRSMHPAFFDNARYRNGVLGNRAAIIPGCETLPWPRCIKTCQRGNLALSLAARSMPLSPGSPLPAVGAHGVTRSTRIGPKVGGSPGWRSAARFEPRIQCHSAIHEDGCAMDVIRIIRPQPHGDAPDVIGFTDAFVRDEFHQLAVRLGCAPRFHVDRCANCAGGDAVDPNAI